MRRAIWRHVFGHTDSPTHTHNKTTNVWCPTSWPYQEKLLALLQRPAHPSNHNNQLCEIIVNPKNLNNRNTGPILVLFLLLTLHALYCNLGYDWLHAMAVSIGCLFYSGRSRGSVYNMVLLTAWQCSHCSILLH